MPAQASEARIGAKPLALRDLSTGTTVVEDVETIPVARPLLPTAAEILPWLHRIDAARVYSNWGPLNSLFEQRLSERFGAHAVTVASGTAGLVCSLLAVCEERPHGLCLLPSWTFVATAHAAAAAGLVPCFLDPDEASWAITPEGVEQAVDGLLSRRCAPFRRVSAVLVVAPFGRPIDVGSWDDFSARTGIPVVIDAAAAVDGLKVGRSPVVVSLHATKCLGIGEGGFVATRDGDLARRIKRAANFGFFGSRRAEVPAINGKLSEYHAAVGLAALQAWPEQRERFLAVARRLAAPLRRAGCIMTRRLGRDLGQLDLRRAFAERLVRCRRDGGVGAARRRHPILVGARVPCASRLRGLSALAGGFFPRDHGASGGYDARSAVFRRSSGRR